MLVILPYFIFNHIIFHCIIRIKRCIFMLHSSCLFCDPSSAIHLSLTHVLHFLFSQSIAIIIWKGCSCEGDLTSREWAAALFSCCFPRLCLKNTVGYPLLHYISLPHICLSLLSLILHQFPLNILFIHTNIPNPLPILYSSIPFYRTVNWFIRSLFCEHTLCMLVLIKKEVIVRAAITNLDLTWPAFTN